MKSYKYAWLINPFTDLFLFVAAPLAILPAVHLLSGFFGFNVVKLAVLSVSATGHHLPGFIRAYTDVSIFRQFRYRLILVPSLLVLLALAAAYYKLSLVFFILIVWSTWHGSMQILGFLRIYDLKTGFQSPMTARLDFWMCLTWFVQVVLWSAPKNMSILSSFYLAGGPLLPIPLVRIFSTGWLALTLAVTLAYLVQTARNAVGQGYLNLPKLLCMLFSFGFWGYCMVSVNNLILGLILWEVFHDLQYNVFVWNYNRRRVNKSLSLSRIENFLFEANWKKISFYVFCIAVYGSLGLLSQDVLNVYENGKTGGNIIAQIGNIFAASAMVHFYLDGFIWKVRDGKVQRDLGVAAADGFHQRPWGLHVIFLSVFFTLAAGLGASEYFHWTAGQEGRQADNLVTLVPKSGYANFVKATQLQNSGHADSAIVYFERAITYDTNYGLAHAFIADLKVSLSDFNGAIANYNKSLELDPQDGEVRENLAHLYSRIGQYEQARNEFTILIKGDSANADYAYEMAWALLQLKRGLEAKPFLERTLALNPNQPRALNYLGMVEQALGSKERARELYIRALTLDSNYAHALENLRDIDPLMPGKKKAR